MATTTSTTEPTTAKSLTGDEVKLLNEFTNTVNARMINKGSIIQKLHLIYDKDAGYTIDLVENPKEVPEAVV